MTEDVKANEESVWPLLRAEFIGTALLLLIGLSLVIVMFGDGSPAARVVTERGRAAGDLRFPVRLRGGR